MSYKPRSDRTRWAFDQIIAALRVHGELTTAQLAETIGCRPSLLVQVLPHMSDARVVEQLLNKNLWGPQSLSAWWQLGPNAPAAVDIERFEPFPMGMNDGDVDKA